MTDLAAHMREEIPAQRLFLCPHDHSRRSIHRVPERFQMRTTLPPNQRPPVDAGIPLPFAIESPCPGTTEAECWAH
jgi:hypothetical protein